MNISTSMFQKILEIKTENPICRLCLNTCDVFEAITEDTKDTLNNLQLEIDLSKTHDPVICGRCSESIRTWFEFKYSRMQARDYVTGHSFCGLCKETVTPTDFVSLNADEKSVTSVKIILMKYFREIDVDRIEDPVICASCYKTLESCSSFISTCLKVEEIVQKYFEDNGIDSMERIELCRVLKNSSVEFNEIKTEEIYSTTKENTFDATCLLLEDTKIDIKCEDVPKLELGDQKIEIKYEDVSEENYNLLTPKQSSYECKVCDYRTEVKTELENHTTSHKTMDKLKIYKCNICEYQTRFVTSYRWHMMVHKNSFFEVPVHKCTQCGSEFKFKHSLQTHMLTHKSRSESTMHKCTLCSFETKYSCSLKQHLAMHKRKPNKGVHRCTHCSFDTRDAYALSQHIIEIHKGDSEVIMYKCYLCGYKTNRKSSLNRHIMVHKNGSEPMVYKCDVCEYQAKLKTNLRRHKLMHKRSPDITMHRCTQCGFETKHKASKNSTVVGKDVDGLVMYVCPHCRYQERTRCDVCKHIQETSL